jgi:hypothetical protein
MLPLVLVAAIVTQDATPLRAAPKEQAARQTLLYGGDWLELRGERQGWLQVYDHRHERPGYVRPSQVRAFPVEEKAAGELAAVIDFVRDQPGSESLGIGLAALFLRAAPANAVGAEVFDALGTMAERLGRRASSKWARPNDATLAGQIEVAESYGVKFASFVASGELDGRTRVCYDGEAYRRVLALPASATAKARAALGLTDPACVDPAMGPSDRETLGAWQADVLAKVDTAALPAWLANRMRIRAASVHAAITYAHARKGQWDKARADEAEAEKALAGVDKPELADEDALGYDEAALRVAAVRWAAGSGSGSRSESGVEIVVGRPGETCVRFAKVEHCTYAVVWTSSLRVSPRGDAIAFAQSPLPSWTELVLLRRGHEPETLAPAAIDPDVGYVELAGWSPDGTRVCVAKEAKMTGPLGQPGTLAPWMQRSFQIVKADGLLVEKQAARLDNFVTFRRWASASWQRATLALR